MGCVMIEADLSSVGAWALGRILTFGIWIRT